MSSGQEESDLVAKVISSEVFQNTQLYLPEIINFLERESCSAEFGNVLLILLKDGFKHFEVHSIQKLLLQDILLTSKKIFNDCLDSIRFNLKTASGNSPSDTEFSLNQLLKVCLDVLEGYSALLSEVSRLQFSVEAEYMDSIPKTLISVTGEAFIHCRESNSIYGSFFDCCSSNLSSLFRKSFEVEKCLLKVLDEHLIFQTHSEDDICLLLLVLEKVIEISEIMLDFEVGNIVDQWKGFVKMMSKYCESLRNRLDLTRAFSCLTSTLHIIITSIFKQKGVVEDRGNWLNRQLKLGNFVLKVVIKLCELYTSHLSQRTHHLLLQLLIHLHGEDEVCEEAELCRLFRSHITVGTSPLLSHLLSDPTFIQEWEGFCCEESLKSLRRESKLGTYSLCVHLCKKLVASNTLEKQLPWIQNNLLTSVLNIIAHCSEEIKLSGGIEKQEGYSIIVASLSILMTSTLETDLFQQHEKHLFYSFSTGNYFVKLFIQDLLCLLARLTNESVVMSWLDWLERVKKEIQVVQFDPLLVHLNSLETRLTAFLSPRAKKSRHRSVPPQTLSQLIRNPPSQPKPQHFNNLVDCVERLRLEDGVCCDGVVESLWHCLEATKPENLSSNSQICGKSTLWWTRLLSSLCKTTSKSLQQLPHLESILELMHRLIEKSDSFVKLSILDTVGCLLHHPVSLKSESLANIAFQILHTSILDSDPIIKLISFEILYELNKVERHNYNMNLLLENNEDVCILFTDFHKGSSLVHDPAISQDIFSQDMSKNTFSHKCSNIIPTFSGGEDEPPTKKVKVPCREINELIAKSKLIQKEMKKFLEEFSMIEGLSMSQQNNLSDLIAQYESLRKFL